MYIYLKISSYNRETECVYSFTDVGVALHFINKRHLNIEKTVVDGAGNICGFLCKTDTKKGKRSDKSEI